MLIRFQEDCTQHWKILLHKHTMHSSAESLIYIPMQSVIILDLGWAVMLKALAVLHLANRITKLWTEQNSVSSLQWVWVWLRLLQRRFLQQVCQKEKNTFLHSHSHNFCPCSPETWLLSVNHSRLQLQLSPQRWVLCRISISIPDSVPSLSFT